MAYNPLQELLSRYSPDEIDQMGGQNALARLFGATVDPMNGNMTMPAPSQAEIQQRIQASPNNDVLVAPETYDMGGRRAWNVNGDFQVYAGADRPQTRDLGMMGKRAGGSEAQRIRSMSQAERDAVLGGELAMGALEHGADPGSVIERVNPTRSQQPQQQQRMMQVIGSGNGTTVTLAPEQAPEKVNLDYSRPQIDTMGGKAYYSKDEPGVAYVMGPNGPKAKVILGYDMAGSMALNKADLERRKGEAGIAQTAAQTQHTIEQTEASRAQRNQREGLPGMGIPQSVLEKQFGKPPKDMQWSEDGRAIPIAGGEVDKAAQSAVDMTTDAIRNIDDLIGKRDTAGNLVAGSKVHPGFETAVGASGFSGGFGLAGLLPGTDTTDFKKRLDELKGKTFLQAYNSLKGGGAISEAEGKKAETAISRMDTAQSEKEFLAAAQEFRGILLRGLEKSQGQRAPQVGTQGAKSTGSVFNTPPNPAQYKGKIMVTDDGTKFRSDGARWVRI